MAFTQAHNVYSQELADSICERIASGDSLVKVCKDIDIAYKTVHKWLRENGSFRRDYAQAREDQGDADADKISWIAEQVSSGLMDAQAGRCAIDAYKWTAAKRKAKVYGEKLEVSGIPASQSATLVILPMQERIKAMRERREAVAAGETLNGGN